MGKFSSQKPPVITQIPHRVRGASNSIGLEAINHIGRGMVCRFFMFLYVSNGWTHMQKAAFTHQTGPGSFRALWAFWYKQCRHLLQYLQSVCSEMETPEKQCCWKGTFKPGVLLLHFFVIEKKTCRFYRFNDGNQKNASVSALQLHGWVFVSITVNWNKWATWIFLVPDCQQYLLEPPCCLKSLHY